MSPELLPFADYETEIMDYAGHFERFTLRKNSEISIETYNPK